MRAFVPHSNTWALEHAEIECGTGKAADSFELSGFADALLIFVPRFVRGIF